MAGYTVTRESGLIVVRGPVPIMDFVALSRSWSENEAGEQLIADGRLADWMGASIVCGTAEACVAMRERLGIGEGKE